MKSNNINSSAEKLVKTFMNTKTPAGKKILQQARKLLKDGEKSGEIRKKLIKHRYKITIN